MWKLLAALLLFASAVHSQVTRVPDLVAKDLHYCLRSNRLYASIAAASPVLPNSIAILDPNEGTLLGSIPVGQDPGRMAFTEDESYLFVALDGESAVQRIRLIDGVAEAPFRVDFAATDPRWLEDDPARTTRGLQAVAGRNDTVAVAQSQSSGHHIGIAVYRNGSQLPNITPPSTHCSNLTPGSTADTMWCYNNYSSGFELYRLRVDDEGVSLAGEPIYGLAYGYSGALQFHGGLLYTNAGARVIDPDRGLIVGSYGAVGTPTGSFAVDEDAGVIYFARRSGYLTYLFSFDLARFTLIGEFESGSVASKPFPGMPGTPSVFVLSGPDRLAGIDSQYGQIYLWDRSLLSPFSPEEPRVTDLGNGVRSLSLPNNAITYDPVSDRIFAAVRDIPDGNALVAVDPVTLTAGQPLWVGSLPWQLAVSDDGQHLYQSLLGANYIQRVDLRSFSRELRIPVFSNFTGMPTGVSSLAVLPGQPNAVAVSLTAGSGNGYSENHGVAIYDGVTRRPVVYDGSRAEVIQVSESRVFAYDNETTGSEFAVLQILPEGVRSLKRGLTVPTCFNCELVCQGDICLTGGGTVIDASSYKILGKCGFNAASVNDTPVNSVALDVPNRKAYSINAPVDGNTFSLIGCDLDSFLPVEKAILPMLDSYPANLLLWRSDQFAFSTARSVVTVPKSVLRPIPPTPPPTPTQREGHLHLSLSHSAAVYDPVRRKLYVAVPPTRPNASESTEYSFGRSVAVVDPVTARVEDIIPVGGDPVALDLADDSSYLYVQLRYADTIVRLDLASRRIDMRVVLPEEPRAFRVRPGHSETIAVAYGQMIAVYSRRSLVGGPYDLGSPASTTSIEFGADSSNIYAVIYGGIVHLRLSEAGITHVRTLHYPKLGVSLRRLGARFYDENGRLFDAETLKLADELPARDQVVADLESGILFGSGFDSLSAYDSRDLKLIGTWSVRTNFGLLVPCGSSRVAHLYDGIHIFTAESMAPAPPLPTTGTTGIDGLMRLNIFGTSIAYDGNGRQLLVTTSPDAGPDGNALLRVDTSAGTLLGKVAVGNRPRILSANSESALAYLGLDGPRKIARFDLRKNEITSQCSTPAVPYRNPIQGLAAADSMVARGLAELSEGSESVIVSVEGGATGQQSFVAVLDHCQPRQDIAGTQSYVSGVGRLALTESKASVYTSPLTSWAVTANGLTGRIESSTALRDYKDWAMCGSLMYTSGGEVYDTDSRRVTADIGIATDYGVRGQAVACNVATDRLYLGIKDSQAGDLVVWVYRLAALTPLTSVRFKSTSDILAVEPCESQVAILLSDGQVVLVPGEMLSHGRAEAVVNSANFRQGIAPGGLFSIFGMGLSSGTFSAQNVPLPTQLGGVSVTVGGRPAPLLYVSPKQINAQVPFEAEPCEQANSDCTAAAVVVTVDGVTLPGISATVSEAAPAVFQNVDGYAVAQNEDYTLNTDANPAQPGSVVILYATGLGHVSNEPASGAAASSTTLSRAEFPVSASVGVSPVEVMFAGLAPGFVGLAQLNVRLPLDLSPGLRSVFIHVGPYDSRMALIFVK